MADSNTRWMCLEIEWGMLHNVILEAENQELRVFYSAPDILHFKVFEFPRHKFVPGQSDVLHAWFWMNTVRFRNTKWPRRLHRWGCHQICSKISLLTSWLMWSSYSLYIKRVNPVCLRSRHYHSLLSLREGRLFPYTFILQAILHCEGRRIH